MGGYTPENTSTGGGGGGGGGGGSPTPTPSPSPTPTYTPDLSVVVGKTYGISSEFAADNATRMPSPSNSALVAAAKARRDLLARSGRASTRLVGTQVYGNAFLGSTA